MNTHAQLPYNERSAAQRQHVSLRLACTACARQVLILPRQPACVVVAEHTSIRAPSTMARLSVLLACVALLALQLAPKQTNALAASSTTTVRRAAQVTPRRQLMPA
jgi:hypothetical protein